MLIPSDTCYMCFCLSCLCLRPGAQWSISTIAPFADVMFASSLTPGLLLPTCLMRTTCALSPTSPSCQNGTTPLQTTLSLRRSAHTCTQARRVTSSGVSCARSLGRRSRRRECGSATWRTRQRGTIFWWRGGALSSRPSGLRTESERLGP